MSTNTIAAVATALTNSGISIIRISGNDSLNIINSIFKSTHKIEANKIIYGNVINGSNIVDKALVSYFKAPKSFTGEDVCEINCHGGIQITKQVLELVLKNGARLAEPGEFTKRAFLNGKLDLTQAEATINLINSKTKIEAKIAENQLEGKLSKQVNKIRENLIELLASIEVSIDYPEYDYEEVENSNVIELLNSSNKQIKQLIDTYDQGRYIKGGIDVALVGKPNVGKSSLLNFLAKCDKSIVTDIPGTTRDIVEETVNIGPIVLNVSDTAGIRNTEEIIEKIGVEKSLKKLEDSDLVIYLLSADENIESSDIATILKMKKEGIKFITAINKSDKLKKPIFNAIVGQLEAMKVEEPIVISVKEEKGIENLKNKIIAIFNCNDFDVEHESIITNERHKDLLNKAFKYIEEAKKEIKHQQPIDIIGIYIINAAKSLGNIIGLEVSEDVVKKIFEKFCLGK
ncbi:MAG: tRNA uridine-5-carboxymethylaminomethyl(34) synthesis GTPase MnmE [Clostridia bacterium]